MTGVSLVRAAVLGLVGVSAGDIWVANCTMAPNRFGKLSMMCSSYAFSFVVTYFSLVSPSVSEATASHVWIYPMVARGTFKVIGYLYHRPFSSNYWSRRTSNNPCLRAKPTISAFIVGISNGLPYLLFQALTLTVKESIEVQSGASAEALSLSIIPGTDLSSLVIRASADRDKLPIFKIITWVNLISWPNEEALHLV